MAFLIFSSFPAERIKEIPPTMMKMRLRKNIPAYRLVVAEKSSAVKTSAMEYLGHYLPARDPHVFEFNEERIAHWLKLGAQPSDTAARLLTRAGMKNLEKFVRRYTKRKKKGEEAAPAVAAPSASAAPAEAPAETPKEQTEASA